MKRKDFDQLAIQYFGEVLIPQGFEFEESRYSRFYRKYSDDVYHLIVPSQRTRRTQYEVRVFATSPRIEADFDSIFPDDLGIPSENYSFLNPYDGVGPSQELYWCRTEEGFVRNFRQKVEPLLIAKAIPFLDNFKSLRDLIPFLNGPFYVGMALWWIGEKGRAGEILREEKAWLETIEDDTGHVASRVVCIENLLRADAGK